MRSFEFARKMENKKPVLDENNNEVLAYPQCQLPEYQTPRSAGADFFCAQDIVVPSIWRVVLRIMAEKVGSAFTLKEITEDEKKEFSPKPTLIHTGIKSAMEDDEVLELYNRSSNPAKLGLILANSVGVIDADYYNNPDNDGDIMFAYYNIMPYDIEIKTGDRIGQGVFKKQLRPDVGLRVKNAERTGGFGSTGKN